MKLTLENLVEEVQKLQDVVNSEDATDAEKFLCLEMLESLGSAIYETAHEFKKPFLAAALTTAKDKYLS